ncbi:MAG: hypothetical protein ACOYMB_03785 [Patescibacteria group bacterium]
MTERISMVLPELNPEVQQLNKEYKNSWARSGFEHIGSTQNGSFVREWNTREFRDQIKYLKTDDDIIFYLRTILQDPKMCELFAKEMAVYPDEFWENSYEREESPNLKLNEYLEKHFWKALAVEGEIRGVLKTLSDDFLLETLKVYNREIGRIRMETLEIIEQMRKDFMPNLEGFVERHSLVIDWPEIEHKFNTVSYDLFDQYSCNKKNKHIAGDYDKNSHIVRVEISPFSRVEFSTLQHEHIHAVSGRKNVINLMSRGSFDDKVYMTRSIPRLGASFDHTSSHPDRFNWLNEAITEHINIDIKKEIIPKDQYFDSNDSYYHERKLFELILTSGKEPIPPRLFYQAYFESDTEKPVDLERRKELYDGISKAYNSPRFLVELDDMIKEIGLKPAIEIFKSSGQIGVQKWWEGNFLNKN